jgi:hypothetical protein
MAVTAARWCGIVSTIVPGLREGSNLPQAHFQRANVRLMEHSGPMPCCNIVVGGRASLLTVSPDYRRYAQACLEMADATDDERTRALFIQMAQVWFRLAERRPSNPEIPRENTD